jgi:hypothetical protein
MVSATVTQAPRPRRPRRRRGRDCQGPRLYRVREFVAAYAVAVLTNIACLLLMPPLIILVYPGTGIGLSRYIGKRIIWWTFTANVQNVSSTKLHLILTWPVSVPIFLIKLFVAKFL